MLKLSIMQTITDVKRQYAVSVYNLDNINSVNDSEIQFTISDELLLETLLIQNPNTNRNLNNPQKERVHAEFQYDGMTTSVSNENKPNKLSYIFFYLLRPFNINIHSKYH